MWRLAVPSVWATRELATDKVYLKRRARFDHANLELTAKVAASAMTGVSSVLGPVSPKGAI
jgi:hypothetical protein